MHKLVRNTSLVAAGAVVAVVAVNPAQASASIASVLLGRSNTTTAATVITNKSGTPLVLNAKAGYAPLRVNSATKVPYLNADKLDGVSSESLLRTTGKAADANKLDGLDSTAFARTAGRTGVVVGTNPGDGAVCPAGSVITGGGGAAMHSGLDYSGPDLDANGNFIANSWYAESTDTTDPAYSFAICYSPTGAISTPALTQLQSTALHRVLGTRR